jgi:hypothetical protein
MLSIWNVTQSELVLVVSKTVSKQKKYSAS